MYSLAKPVVAFICLLWLLQGCHAFTNSSEFPAGSTANCPKPTSALPNLIPETGNNFYELLDYRVRQIVKSEETIRFQSRNYDFVFCRGNRTFTVQQTTLNQNPLLPTDEEGVLQDFANPPYKKIDVKGQGYRYRVLIEPSQGENRRKPPKVIFELITPNSNWPQRHVLYTLSDVQQAKLGITLGVPKVTATLMFDNHLWWSISSEQGEGANGIATLVSYHLQKGTWTLFQPDELKGIQITDLAISGDRKSPTFWIGTQMSSEGNDNLPALGLVAYRPKSQQFMRSTIVAYNVHNSPLIGAIPDRLFLEKDGLWVSTGNGICQVSLANPQKAESWSCWRFSLLAKLPEAGLPVYSSLLSKRPVDTFFPTQKGETVEILWRSPLDRHKRQGRYEVRYPKGFTVTLADQGAIPVSEILPVRSQSFVSGHPVYWPGQEWHWRGDRFVRGLDEVAMNYFGDGPRGIGPDYLEIGGLIDRSAIRGDLELLRLSRQSVTLKYYSGWVNESALAPYPAILRQESLKKTQQNPLIEIGDRLSPQ